jgi:hypothetical protein
MVTNTNKSSEATRRALDHATKNLMAIIADFYHMEFKYSFSSYGDIFNKYIS